MYIILLIIDLEEYNEECEFDYKPDRRFVDDPCVGILNWPIDSLDGKRSNGNEMWQGKKGVRTQGTLIKCEEKELEVSKPCNEKSSSTTKMERIQAGRKDGEGDINGEDGQKSILATWDFARNKVTVC